MLDLLRFNKNQKYLIFDLETEGLNTLFSRPWSVGWIIADLDKIYEEHEYFIKWPNLNISKEAQIKTRFNQLEYEQKAQDSKVILDKFEGYLNNPDLKILTFNGLTYDFMILNVWRRFLGLKPYWGHLEKLIDVHILTKVYKMGGISLYPPFNQSFLTKCFQIADFKKKGLKTSLNAISKEFNLPYDENINHSALKDAISTWEVFKKLIWLMEI
jgi:DNA polymerase III alpha subunit (gram-positive type)